MKRHIKILAIILILSTTIFSGCGKREVSLIITSAIIGGAISGATETVFSNFMEKIIYFLEADHTSKRDIELEKRNAELAKRDAELAKRDAELAKRDAELAKRDAELAKRNAELTKRKVEQKKDNEFSRQDDSLKIPKDAKRYNGHSYYIFSNVTETWEEAQEFCVSLGGYLAIISDEDENKFLYEMMRSYGLKNAYFGLCDKNATNTWRWVDGKKATFLNWGYGEPNHTPKSEHYGMFYRGTAPYKWNDGSFTPATPGGGKAFICEWEE